MTEKDLLKKLRTRYEPRGWLIEVIENGSINPGFPDTIFIKHPYVLFVELKAIPETDHICIPWQPGQRAKLQRLEAHGAKCLVCIAVGREWYFLPLLPYDHLGPSTAKSYEQVIKDGVLESKEDMK